MAQGQIGLKFSLNKFPIQEKFDIRINIREDFNFLRYGSEFGLQNVGVSFIDAEPINVEENIIIDDLTRIVPENSPDILTEDIFSTQNFSLTGAEFLITDIFKTESSGIETPLYFGHDLSQYSSISDIKILDGNFEPVNQDLYLYLDEELALGLPHKFIYTNLKSIFDIAKNIFTVYYVRFKDDTTGEFITEILNSKELYSKSTFATTSKDRAYTISPTFGNASVSVHFDSKIYGPTTPSGVQRFSVKVEGDNRINVLRPTDMPATEKWYPRINPGEFFKNTVSGDARYHIPEYQQQLFSPVSPYKLLVEKRARVLTSRILFVEPKPIANLGINGFYIYVILKNKFGNVTRALTNDPDASVYTTPNGVVTEVFFEKGTIQSVAEEDGFIRLDTDIDIDSLAYVTYRYVEKHYTYRGLSLNSTTNPNILNRKALIYIKPSLSETLTKTVYHLLVDENNLILESNESDNFITINGIANSGTMNGLTDSSLSSSDIYTDFELEILSGINAGRKLKIASYSTTLKTLTVAEPFAAEIAEGTRYRINKKDEDYSFQDPVSLTTFNYTGWKTEKSGAPFHYILLAETYSVQTIAPKDISRTDIRIRGGGIKEDKIKGSLKLQDQIQWYWDVGYWDGQPYPGMGAILVELPRNILKEVGGDFSREQVKEIVEKHMASGSYPVIKYYDRSTKILSIQPMSKKISLSWLDVKADAYNIYLGQNPDQLSLYRLVAGVITDIEVENLENDKVYYLMVESIFGNTPQLPSRIAFGIPFDPTSSKAPAIYGETSYLGGTYSNG